MKDHLALEATYQKAKINNNKLVFETYQGLSQALNEGAFYVKMPDYFNHHIANKFATNYYLDKDGIDDKYKGFRGKFNELSKSEKYLCKPLKPSASVLKIIYS